MWTNDVQSGSYPTWTYNAQAVGLAVRKLPIMADIRQRAWAYEFRIEATATLRRSAQLRLFGRGL